jgi:hypothetical protein
MIGLALFQVNTTAGVEITLRAEDFRRATRITAGSELELADGRTLVVSQTPDEIYSAINTKWTDYTTALGDPA